MAHTDAADILDFDEGRWSIFGQEEKNTAEVIKMVNVTSHFSPITLNTSWCWIWRFSFLLVICGIGTIGNAFYIATFVKADKLTKKGNVYLICLGVVDLIITSVVMPIVMGVILFDLKETIGLCRFLQLLTQWSTYSYSLFFMLVAIDINKRVLRGLKPNCNCIHSCPFRIAIVFIFTISLITAGFGIYFDLDYDYCTRQHHGNHWFRLITTIAFYMIPFLVNLYLLLHASEAKKQRNARYLLFQRPPLRIKNVQLSDLHIISYTLNVYAWVPYLIIVNWYPDISDSNYYVSVWTGMLRSIISGYIYVKIVNLLRAFYRVFMYCCCCTDVQPTNRRVSRRDNYSPYTVRALVVRNLNSPRRNGVCDDFRLMPIP